MPNFFGMRFADLLLQYHQLVFAFGWKCWWNAFDVSGKVHPFNDSVGNFSSNVHFECISHTINHKSFNIFNCDHFLYTYNLNVIALTTLIPKYSDFSVAYSCFYEIRLSSFQRTVQMRSRFSFDLWKSPFVYMMAVNTVP